MKHISTFLEKYKKQNDYDQTVKKLRESYELLSDAEKIAVRHDPEIALIIRDIANELKPMAQ